MNLAIIHNLENEMLQAFASIPLGMSKFQIDHFVLSQESPGRRYRQVVLELHQRYLALKAASFRQARLHRELEILQEKLDKGHGDAILTRIDLEEKAHDKAMDDLLLRQMISEAQGLLEHYQAMEHFTADEFEHAEMSYWQTRLLADAERQMISNGTVDAGLLRSVQDIGGSPMAMLGGLKALLGGEPC